MSEKVKISVGEWFLCLQKPDGDRFTVICSTPLTEENFRLAYENIRFRKFEPSGHLTAHLPADTHRQD